MTWTESREELLFLHSNHKNIKFEINISHSNISFLDTLISEGKNPIINNPISMHTGYNLEEFRVR